MTTLEQAQARYEAACKAEAQAQRERDVLADSLTAYDAAGLDGGARMREFAASCNALGAAIAETREAYAALLGATMTDEAPTADEGAASEGEGETVATGSNEHVCESCEFVGVTRPATWVSSESETYACDEHGPFYLDDMTPAEGVLAQDWTRLDGTPYAHHAAREARRRLEVARDNLRGYAERQTVAALKRECADTADVLAQAARGDMTREALTRALKALNEDEAYVSERAEQFPEHRDEFERRVWIIEDGQRAIKAALRILPR